jgi:5-methylcytosine-specific restriction endonuclease McrBC regulatory subunit McrC
VVRTGQLPVVRQYYIDIAKVCLLIARNRSVVPQSIEGSARLLSFVINLEDVFEKYVRNTLKAFARNHYPDVAVRNGNVEGRSHLFYDSRAIEIKPDVIVVRDNKPRLVADIKYKPKTTEADRYQIISHAAALDASIAVSVLPATEDQTGLVRRGQVHDANGIQVFEYYMPLQGDIAQQERAMAERIFALLPHE